jgi:hypothetical protein
MKQLSPIDPEELSNLYAMLESARFQKESYENRKGFGANSRCLVFGIRRTRCTREVGLSSATLKYPHIWDEMKRIGNLIKGAMPPSEPQTDRPQAELRGFEFTSVHLNKNVVCDWHTDKGNVGDTVIVSLGDYEGCELELRGVGSFNTNCSPILFDGKQIEHRTTPLLSGTKYSIVFYTHECARGFSPST